MDTDGSQCPENSNSTDCLLRALLQLLKEHRETDEAEIDWDPISFAFTLLIGCLATAFALATILQAIFAAGKGRRRTSHFAIGKWSRKTKRRWDWSEMNFRFTASTPILREQSLRFMPLRSEAAESKSLDSTGSSYTTFRHRIRGLWAHAPWVASYLHPSQTQRPSAAWLEFFEEVGLEKVDTQAWGHNVREVSAEYLPDDLVAAPAYAQLGAIVAAVATAGIQKLEMDQQRYPILLGRGFQVDFRQHPVLGVVGAYSRYDKKDETTRAPKLEKLRSTMEYGCGIIDTGVFSIDLSTKSKRRLAIERWNLTPKSLAVAAKPSTHGIFAVKLAAISEVHLPLIAGLFALTPKHVPALFPTTTMRTSLSLTVLALSGRFWAEARLDIFNQSDIIKWPASHVTPSWDGFKWHDFIDSSSSSAIKALFSKIYFKHQAGKLFASLSLSHYDKQGGGSAEEEPAPAEAKKATGEAPELAAEDAITSGNKLGIENAVHKRTHITNGYCLALHMCVKFLQGPERFEEWLLESSIDEQNTLRCIILEQIKEVDTWLLEKCVDLEDLKGRSIILCNTTIAFSQAEQMIKDGLFTASESETTPRHISSQSVEHNHCQSTNQGGPNQDTARGLHFTTLQALRKLVDNFDENLPGVRELTNLVDSEFSQSSRLWDRIRALVVYHSAEDAQWPLWDQFHRERNNELHRDINDVIIYRCLMMILLFRTAADSSKMLESGLWEKVVPII
ncbi:hypothetical protein J7T55_000380 [Diaporthe amygdali]|uniref:uncharacterized protein n=1 Tax=Phomopsis amygdali TaxID=1214568 RepID=UPI0022FE725B|nr:uncharacterized protein J7T55_000380 [Diaporthe amygdali]KAJ0109455.1 hypothetical protein J7T55_000380 [Diaporthe amygdali]